MKSVRKQIDDIFYRSLYKLKDKVSSKITNKCWFNIRNEVVVNQMIVTVIDEKNNKTILMG